VIRLGGSHDHGYPEDHGHHHEHGAHADHHHHPYPHADHPLGRVTLPKVPGRLAREDQQG
jgi:sirohydrochlorin cobaltochelatase